MKFALNTLFSLFFHFVFALRIVISEKNGIEWKKKTLKSLYLMNVLSVACKSLVENFSFFLCVVKNILLMCRNEPEGNRLLVIDNILEYCVAVGLCNAEEILTFMKITVISKLYSNRPLFNINNCNNWILHSQTRWHAGNKRKNLHEDKTHNLFIPPSTLLTKKTVMINEV